MKLNDSIRTFLESEMAALGLGIETLRAWRPAARSRAPKAAKKSRRSAAPEAEAPTETTE
jgi:hypothetical protein